MNAFVKTPEIIIDSFLFVLFVDSMFALVYLQELILTLFMFTTLLPNLFVEQWV